MDVTKIVYGIIGITVGVIVVSGVLLGAIKDATAENTPGAQYASIFGLVGILSIIVLVMWAVRMMGGSKN